jgi:ADP-heptose:LPS heptosyltransferase
MDVKTRLRIDRHWGGLICRILSLFSRKGKKEADPQGPKRILVLLLSEMGSLVLAYPMFRRIAKKYPQASVYVLLFNMNREVLDLLEIVPRENVLTINARCMLRFVKDTIGVLIRMRRLRFDTVIDCELFARFSSILSFLSGASTRVGFHAFTMEGLYRGAFINRPVLFNPYHAIPGQFVGLVEAIESNATPSNKFMAEYVKKELPRARIEETEIIVMKRRLYSDYPAIEGKELILLYPSGGILPIRAWPAPYFAKVAEGLVGKGYAVGIIGLEEDRGATSEILSQCRTPACVDLTGYAKSVRQLVTLFHTASLLIANDGGPGQFAALAPIKTILLFGPETPVLYGPLDADAHVFYRPMSCSPCLTAYNHRNSPCDGDNVCLKSIHPEEVLDKAISILHYKRQLS